MPVRFSRLELFNRLQFLQHYLSFRSIYLKFNFYSIDSISIFFLLFVIQLAFLWNHELTFKKAIRIPLNTAIFCRKRFVIILLKMNICILSDVAYICFLKQTYVSVPLHVCLKKPYIRDVDGEKTVSFPTREPRNPRYSTNHYYDIMYNQSFFSNMYSKL